MSPSYSLTEQKYLLNLARCSIKHYLEARKTLEIPEQDVISDNLKTKKATFVSLHIENNLRGCVGCLEAIKPLYIDARDNAIAAAFFDVRFLPLTAEEFNNILIEISILSESQKLKYQNSEDLLKQLTPQKHGVIIKKDSQQAVFLPQVWQQLPNKADFLSHLCLKAGLPNQSWQTGNLEVFVYEVEIVG